jgi:NAD-dependent SIR2 family protein deacetylase
MEVSVDETVMRAREPLPRCPSCGGPTRPNILMFDDSGWDDGRTRAQQARLRTWLTTARAGRMVVIECGAGSAIPTVRYFCEEQAASPRSMLIRINPHEPAVPRGHLGLPMGALDALRAMDHRLQTGAWSANSA